MQLIIHRDGRITYKYTLGGVAVASPCLSDLPTGDALRAALAIINNLSREGLQIEFCRPRDSRPHFSDFIRAYCGDCRTIRAQA